jgi:hypothetical protein
VDTDSVLASALGLDQATIERLRAQSIVG